ncbi:MAG: hypothetical protein N2319_12125 [Candidatus Kapabacteria bacterium]|nr:hypothetical protein [Candidatus Kapabacteria bacterium]
MTYDEYIKIADDNDLYYLTKNLLIKEHQGYVKSSKILDLLQKEASRRNASFVSDALNEIALYIQANEDFQNVFSEHLTTLPFNHNRLNGDIHKILNHPAVLSRKNGLQDQEPTFIESCFESESEYFFCKVKGNDLFDDVNGDTFGIIVRKKSNPLNGQNVVVNYQSKIQVKKFYKKNGKVWLMSGKDNSNKVEVQEGEFKILGVVTQVVKEIKG